MEDFEKYQKNNLYESLKYIHNEFKRVQKDNGHFQKVLDIEETIKQMDNSRIPQIQKEFLQSYIAKHGNNQTLTRALEGNQTLYDRLEELTEEGKWNKYHGLRRLWPINKNGEYNNKILELNEIIPVDLLSGTKEFLKSKRINLPGATGLALYVPSYALYAQDIADSFPMHLALLAVAGHASLVGFYNFLEGRESKKAAKYLDDLLPKLN